MPIEKNISASDYTAYLKAKATAAVNTREPRLNDAPVQNTLLNTALKSSQVAQKVNSAQSVLGPYVPQSLQRPTVNPRAKSTISWLNPGVTR